MLILISMQRHFNYGKREMNMHVENLILSSIVYRCRFVGLTMSCANRKQTQRLSAENNSPARTFADGQGRNVTIFTGGV